MPVAKTRKTKTTRVDIQRYLLHVYLRDFYSEYHVKRPDPVTKPFRNLPKDVDDMVAYWMMVERTGSMKNNNRKTTGEKTQKDGSDNQFAADGNKQETPKRQSGKRKREDEETGNEPKRKRLLSPLRRRLFPRRSLYKSKTNGKGSDTPSHIRILSPFPIAAHLAWPRTILRILPEQLISSGSSLPDIPCSLAKYRGEVKLPEFRHSTFGLGGNDILRKFSHVLSLTMQSWETVSDGAFQHLTNLRSLDISDCNQKAITDNAFRHLTNLTSLNMSQCNQKTITNEAFRHLTNLQDLNMESCDQRKITNEAFRHLTNLQSLNMSFCKQSTVTKEAFQHLKKVRSLVGRDGKATNPHNSKK